jgi:predicted unusual protein kinase regulating ubiquinone biosynthesis (AarF/ABC1/UbiB family)
VHLIIEPVDLSLPPRGAAARRLGRGATSLARSFVRTRRLVPALRATVDELGGTFTKLGQLFGSSPSLFGEVIAAEFRGCLDDAPPVVFPDVRRVVEGELGATIEDLFATFEPVPLATGSLAVVHGATLPDGARVAVKVLRPGIEEIVATDLAVLRPICSFLGRQVAVGIAGTLPGLVDGLSVQLAEELDLRNEASAMVWFAELLEAVGGGPVRVPQPIAAWSGRRVLTMERFDGVPIDDVAGLAALGVDPEPLLRECLKVWFATTLCTGAFHGDIHAGNILIGADGTLGLVDWGIVGRLDAETHSFFRAVVRAVLGDESAWDEVTQHIVATFGDTMGLGAADLAAAVRANIEPLFALPFGQVDLATMLVADASRAGPDAPVATTRREKLRRLLDERRQQRAMFESEGFGSGFDRGTFLLSKQLVYFERYGKLYLPDVPLLFDPELFRTLLDRPAVAIS